MKIKFYSHLSPIIARKQQKFSLENFFEEENQELVKVLQGQLEKFFSLPSGWIFAMENNKIIGQCLLFRRQISDPQVKLGGLGEVCTHKDYRNKGIALALLKNSMKILYKWDCDVAYLNTDLSKLRKLYSKVGFTYLKSGIKFTGRSKVIYKDTSACIAPVKSSKIFFQLLESSSPLFIGDGNW